MILVTGAAGFIGRHVVAELLRQQLPVRVLLAPEELPPALWADLPQPEVFAGRLNDDEVLLKACTGVHTIIHLASAMWWGSQRDLELVELAGTQSLIAVARSARVGRIILLSHLGAASSAGYVLHRVKGLEEELVRGSGLAYTILRSGLVFGPEDAFINHIAMMLSINPLFFLMPGRGEVVLHPLHIDDLTRAIVASLESLDAVDRTMEIGGIEYTTLADLISTVQRVCRRRRVVIPVPPYLMRVIVWLYERIYRRTLMTSQWLDVLATNRTTQLGNMYEYFGFQPRRLEDTLVTYLPRQASARRALRYVFQRRPRANVSV
ncbi:NAD-dependent epimerase/dehydratase family protein [Aggregatilineales bacterium SYSU G02658]